MDKILAATVTRKERLELRNGNRFVNLDLNVSYLSVLQFQRLLASNRPTKPRKRRKRGLAVNESLAMQVWLGPTRQSLRQVDVALALTHPLDAPATISLAVEDLPDIQEGCPVEFRIVPVETVG